MDANSPMPQWTGPRFDLDERASPAPSPWRTVRRFVGLAAVIGCLLLAVKESFRWMEARAKRLNAVAGQAAAKPAGAPAQAAAAPAPANPAVVEGAPPDPQAWVDEQRRQAEAFHEEARKRHQQFQDDMQSRLDDMRRRHEAFRSRARKRHDDFLRQHGFP